MNKTRFSLRMTIAIAMACAVSIPAAIAVASTLGDSESHSGTAAEVASNEPSALPRGPEIDFCPTKEQTDAHSAKYGFDYKPTVPCGDATRMDAPDAKEIPRAPSDESPTTFAEAQARLDPDDDPNVLIKLDAATGEYSSINVFTGEPIPEHVETMSEFQDWAGIEQHGGER